MKSLQATLVSVCILSLMGPFGSNPLHGQPAREESPKYDRDSAKIVRLELSRCPCWLDVRGNETEFRAGILRLYARLARFDAETIREGIKSYFSEYPVASTESFVAGAKIFAFLRIVFKVPDGYTPIGSNLGFWGSPVRDGMIDLLWPFSRDPNGNLKLTGVGIGDYSGPPYDPLAEFDELNVRYPRRSGPDVVHQ